MGAAASFANKNSAVLALVAKYQEQFKTESASKLQRAAATKVMETAGHSVFVVDLGATVVNTNSVGIDITGYSVTIAKGSSDRIACALDLGAAGSYGPVYPGLTVRPQQKFTRIRLKKWVSTTFPLATTFCIPGQVARGRFVTLVVAKTPEATWEEPSNDVGGFNWERVGVQPYNVLTNLPTAAYEGISIRGAQSVRVGLQSLTAILGGTIAWWYNGDSGAVLWGETDVQQVLPVGRTIVWLSELEVKASFGRLFPELRSFTNAGGTGDPFVYLQAFGEGGDLSAADVQP